MNQPQANYLQVLDEGHCFTCHKDYKPSEGTHPCFLLGSDKDSTTPCTKECGKWFHQPTSSEWERKIDEELYFLSQDGYAAGWREMKIEVIKEICSTIRKEAYESGYEDAYNQIYADAGESLRNNG